MHLILERLIWFGILINIYKSIKLECIDNIIYAMVHGLIK